MTHKTISNAQGQWILGLLLLLPAQLGANGCGPGVVGDDGAGGAGGASAGDSSLGDPCGEQEELAPCAVGEYCKYSVGAQCGLTGQSGVCASIPESCMEEYSTVCGCDGNTYTNECLAASKGVSIVFSGPCVGSLTIGMACGGPLKLSPCGENEYCKYAVEAQCGAADQTGTCELFGDICLPEYIPVCGCDGKTYDSACFADRMGMSLVSNAACGDDTTIALKCGGPGNPVPCADGKYCQYSLDAQCGVTDQTGLCATIPEACPEQYGPVCGCDDKTYGNACAAAAMGVSVAATGECVP